MRAGLLTGLLDDETQIVRNGNSERSSSSPTRQGLSGDFRAAGNLLPASQAMQNSTYEDREAPCARSWGRSSALLIRSGKRSCMGTPEVALLADVRLRETSKMGRPKHVLDPLGIWFDVCHAGRDGPWVAVVGPVPHTARTSEAGATPRRTSITSGECSTRSLKGGHTTPTGK